MASISLIERSVIFFLLLPFLTLAQNSTVPSRRAKTLCAFHRISCRLRESKFCPPGEKCVGVRPSENASPKCVYICEPAVSKTTQSNPGETVSGQINVTNVQNDTTPKAKTTIQAESWKNDPSYCLENYMCLQGGHCDDEYKTLKKGSPSCVCPSNTHGTFCQGICSKRCQNSGACTLVRGGREVCVCPNNMRGEFCERAAPVRSDTSSSRAGANFPSKIIQILLFGVSAMLLSIID